MKAFCLSLDKRKKEWTQLKRDANNLGIDCENFVVGDGHVLPREEYNYIDDPNPDVSRWGYGNPKYKMHHYNAFVAHKQIIQKAKDLSLPHFLMLEDDAYFTYRFEEIFRLINESKLYYDILYLGWWIGDENDEWNLSVESNYNTQKQCKITKATRLGGLHAAIINNSMYDYILSLPPIDPIDSQLNKIHSQIESYIVLPKIIHTKTMFSNCEGNVIERNYI